MSGKARYRYSYYILHCEKSKANGVCHDCSPLFDIPTPVPDSVFPKEVGWGRYCESFKLKVAGLSFTRKLNFRQKDPPPSPSKTLTAPPAIPKTP